MRLMCLHAVYTRAKTRLAHAKHLYVPTDVVSGISTDNTLETTGWSTQKHWILPQMSHLES